MENKGDDLILNSQKEIQGHRVYRLSKSQGRNLNSLTFSSTTFQLAMLSK